MFEFLKKMFGTAERRGRSASSAVVAGEDLDQLEVEIAKAGRSRQGARLLNRAGDLYLARDNRSAALQRYGDAIDAYLHSSDYDSAMAVCRKIIRVVPEVIRTRRTLAWLCLGKGFLDIAREHIAAYTSASLQAGLQTLAVQQLLLMSQYVERPEFRDFLAEQLAVLGDEEAGTRVREGKASEGVPSAGWGPVVFAALLKPEELRQALEKGVEIRAPTSDVGVEDFDSLLFDFDLGGPKERRREEDDEGTGSSGDEPAD